MNDEEITNQTSDHDFATLAKALAHPVRLAILRYLKDCPQCLTTDIVNVLPTAQSTTSEHLRILKEAGWVQGAIEGKRCYCLDNQAYARFSGYLKELFS